ncbi:MAG: PH domain-containing protein [Microbacteriaceae bacterium]|nr:PH domain-containing protein [Microbacteriaceae bacterium]
MSIDGKWTPESTVVRLRPKATLLFFPAIIFIAVCGAVGWFIFQLPESWEQLLLVSAALLIILLFSVFPLLRWLANQIVITNRKTLSQRGVLSRHIREVKHVEVSSVQRFQSFWQRMNNSANFLIETVNGTSLLLKNVPGPDLFQAALDEQQAKAKRSALMHSV